MLFNKIKNIKLNQKNTLSKLLPRHPNKILIHKGHSASVYKNHNVVIKSIPISNYRFNNEYHTLMLLNNKYIIKPMDCYDEDHKLNIVYPYHKLGDLYSFIDRYKDSLVETELLVIMKKIIQPILYLHYNNYVHLDLKLENILIAYNNYNKYKVQDNNIKYMINNNFVLIDFEFSRKLVPDYYELHHTKYKSCTELYKPPQIDDNKIGFTSDIYSIGVMFFILKNKRLPNDGDFKSQPQLKLYPDLDEMIFSMLEKNHLYRPTIYEIDSFIDKYIDRKHS